MYLQFHPYSLFHTLVQKIHFHKLVLFTFLNSCAHKMELFSNPCTLSLFSHCKFEVRSHNVEQLLRSQFISLQQLSENRGLSTRTSQGIIIQTAVLVKADSQQIKHMFSQFRIWKEDSNEGVHIFYSSAID